MSRKLERVSYAFSADTRLMLEKLAKIHDRSMTGVLEQLIKKEAKAYGLIESRENVSDN